MSHPHPDLGAPPPLPAHGLRIVALGGIGEIGRNLTVFEHAGRLLGREEHCPEHFNQDDWDQLQMIRKQWT